MLDTFKKAPLIAVIGAFALMTSAPAFAQATSAAPASDAAASAAAPDAAAATDAAPADSSATVDNGGAVRALIRQPDFFRMMGLSPTDGYRLQLAWRLHTDRMDIATGPSLVLRDHLTLTPQQISEAKGAFRYLPASQVNLTRRLNGQIDPTAFGTQ